MTTLQVARDGVAPLELIVSDADGGVAGLTCAVAIRDAHTAQSYLDWSDGTFKTSGWMERTRALSEGLAGRYVLEDGLDLDDITLPAATEVLVAEYSISGDLVGAASDYIQLGAGGVRAELAAELADATLARKMLTNRQELEGFGQVPALLTTYDDDGTTPLVRQRVRTDGGEAVQTAEGVVTKREAPT